MNGEIKEAGKNWFCWGKKVTIEMQDGIFGEGTKGWRQAECKPAKNQVSHIHHNS